MLGEVAAPDDWAAADPNGLEAVPMSLQRAVRDPRDVAHLELGRGVRCSPGFAGHPASSLHHAEAGGASRAGRTGFTMAKLWQIGRLAVQEVQKRTLGREGNLFSPKGLHRIAGAGLEPATSGL